MNNGTVEDGNKGLQREPAFYIRSTAPISMATLGLLLGSLIAVLTFMWNVTDRIQENSRIEVHNERVERISADNEIRGTCCRGRW